MSVITSFNKENCKKFVIEPFSENSISPLGYDLTIGFAIILDKENDNNFNKTNKVTIPPGKSALIITKEYVWLSGAVAGTLHARGSLAAKGLYLNSTTVDPNWYGQMTMLIFNSSQYSVELMKNDRFITMILHETKDFSAKNPGRRPIRIVSKFSDYYGARFSDLLNEYLLNIDPNENLFVKNVDATKNRLSFKIFSIKKYIHSKLTMNVVINALCLFLFIPIIGINIWWDELNKTLPSNINYDSAVFVGQILAILSIVGMAITNYLSHKDRIHDRKNIRNEDITRK